MISVMWEVWEQRLLTPITQKKFKKFALQWFLIGKTGEQRQGEEEEEEEEEEEAKGTLANSHRQRRRKWKDSLS